jgi:hypothetical protein
MVTLLQSSHFQLLHCFITSLHSTLHTVHNQPAAEVKDTPVMGYSGKNVTSTKAIMVGLECYPFQSVQVMGHHLQVIREFLLDLQKTTSTMGQSLAALILTLDLVPKHPGDPRITSQ